MYKHTDDNGDTKFAGRSRGIVIDNRDPLKRGRIRVDHPLLGETVWINYLKVRGHFDPPSIGDLVYVECDTGEHEYPIAWGNLTKGRDTNPELPERFRREVPSNRGLYTPGGHYLEMDDGIAEVTDAPNDKQFTTEKRGVRLTTTAGNKIHISEDTDNQEQYILVEDVNGNKIRFDYLDNNVTIESKDTTDVITAGDRADTTGGNQTEDVTGDRTETVGGNLTVTVTGDINIEASGGAKGKFAGGQVAFGTDSTELLQQISDQLADLQSLFSTVAPHTHIGNLGYPSAPPDTQAAWSASSATMGSIKALIDSIKASL